MIVLKRKKNFYIFLIANLLILLMVILLLVTVTYSNIMKKIQGDIGVSHIETLSQIKYSIENHILKKIDLLAIDLMLSNNQIDAQFFINNPLEGNMFLAVNLYKRLQSIKVNDKFIHSIFIYYRDKGLVISSENGVRKLDADNEKYFASVIPFEELKGIASNGTWLKTRKIIYSNGASNDVIPFVRTFPISSDGLKAQGYIIVNIDEKPLHDTLDEIDNKNMKNNYIIDISGDTISYSEDPILYKGIDFKEYLDEIRKHQSSGSFVHGGESEKMLVSYTFSNFNSWIYITIVPFSVALNKYMFLRKILVNVGALSLFLGFVLVYIAAIGNYRPVKRLSENVMGIMKTNSPNQSAKNVDDYKMISETVLSLSRQVHTLKNFFKKNLGSTQDIMFKNIFGKQVENSEDINKLFEVFGLNFESKYFYIFGVFLDECINNPETMEKRILPDDLIWEICCKVKEEYGGICINVGQEGNCYTFMVNTDNQFIAQKKEVFNRILEFFNQEHLISATITVSQMYSSLVDLSFAYNEIFLSYQYRFVIGKGSVIPYESIKGNKDVDFLDITEISDNIKKYIKLSEVDKVDQTSQLLSERIKSGNYSCDFIEGCTTYIMFEVYNLMKELNMDLAEVFGNQNNIFIEYSHIITLNDFCVWLGDISRRIASTLANKKSSRNEELVNEIKEYVKKNIDNISLEIVSEKFSTSYAYISRVFKEETGENFSKYLERIKVESAYNLLMCSDIGIEELSQKIGYNTKYFIKKFKEFYGQTPYAYKKEMKISNDKNLFQVNKHNKNDLLIFEKL